MKKCLSLFLSLIMVLGVLTSLPLTVTAVKTENIIANGICGDSLFWYIDDNGVLTIYGNGKMENYCYYSEDYFYHPTPWDEFRSSIKKCVIENGITSIGIFSFYDCTNLTSITIPDTVTNIGEKAFYYCESLTSIKIPDSVTSIGNGAFYNTGYYNNENNWENGVLYIGNHLILAEDIVSSSYIVKNGTRTIANNAFVYLTQSLTSITIPDSVISIGEYAFYDCANLISIKIPDSVTSIGTNAFYGCGYYTDLNNWENGVLYINNHLISASEYREYGSAVPIAGDYTIKQGTKTIADNAFINCDITSLVLPDSLVNIGLSGCIVIDGIQTTDFRTFSGCAALASIEVSENNSNYSSKDGVLFNKNKTELIRYPKNKNDSTYTIPNTVNNINYGAFSSCTNLTSITIPDTVTNIGKVAFSYCESLTSIKIPDSVTSIGEEAFYGTGYYDNENNWEKGVLYIGNHLVDAKNDVTLGQYIVKNGTKSIADFAFYCCDSLTSITIPDSVASIGHKSLGYGVKTIDYYGNRDWYKNTNLIIKGYKNSASEIYADENGFTFNELCEHKKTKWITDKKATVYSAGKKHKECTECGEVLETATIKQLKCSKPKLKTISNISSGVKITWGKVSGADKYEVYRKVKGGSYSKVGTTSKTYYTDKKAKSGKKYYYVVKAVNEAGKSDSSSSLSKYYLADPTLKTPTSTKSGVSLKWTKTTGAQGYIIYRKTGSGSYKKLKTEKGVSNLSYVDKSAKKGKKYTYKVKAYYSKTYSAYSNTKTIKDKY